MKLLKEIHLLSEEAIETVSVEDLWQQNKSDAEVYVRTTVYRVRPIPKTSPQRFEVFYDEDGRRKLYGKISSDDLNAAFVEIRPKDKPDAEGFKTYRDADEFEVFKYGGDPVKVNLGDSVSVDDSPIVKLNRGDYVLRQADDSKFIYTVEQARFFDKEYAKK